MSKHFTVIAFSIIVVFNACAQTKKAATTKVPSISYVSMHRTACFGTCPDYMIEVYSTGLTRYTGRFYAEKKGTYEKNIGKTKAATILKSVSKYRLDTCKTEYQNMIPDLPGLIYKITYNGKEKQINNAQFGPDFMKPLATELDEAVGKPDNTWKNTAAYKEQ